MRFTFSFNFHVLKLYSDSLETKHWNLPTVVVIFLSPLCCRPAAEKKKLQLAEKYEELKKSGKLENFLSKKRKRNAGKDRRKLPKQAVWGVQGLLMLRAAVGPSEHPACNEPSGPAGGAVSLRWWRASMFVFNQSLVSSVTLGHPNVQERSRTYFPFLDLWALSVFMCSDRKPNTEASWWSVSVLPVFTWCIKYIIYYLNTCYFGFWCKFFCLFCCVVLQLFQHIHKKCIKSCVIIRTV